MAKSYPMSLRNDRPLPLRYDGPAFVWDIDKTYLSTHFSSWRGLLKIPFELSVDKRAIPGMPEVLRGLRRGSGTEVACHPLYFISASPPFLRASIEGKMLRDGVEHDGITFKDWFGAWLELRPDRLWEQVGFKTAALFRGRMDRVGATEYLFGDDCEKDADAFALYAAFVRKDLDEARLASALETSGVPVSDVALVLDTARALPAQRGRVEKIFIHLEGNSPPQAFRKFGPLLVPVRGAYQLALVLEREGLIDEATLRAARDAVKRVPRYRFSRIEELEEDAKARGLLLERKRFTRGARRKKTPFRAKRGSARHS